MLAAITAGIAPGIALLCFFYLKQHQYGTEPIGPVVRSFVFGGMLVFPVMVIQHGFKVEDFLQSPFSQAYLMSGLLEEFLKWFIFYFTVYIHIEFNDFYDGIVYGVAISLGFASVENVFYLFAYGIQEAWWRALLPVSSHALFGLMMGSYLGRGKFTLQNKIGKWISLSLLVPFLFHGTYNYLVLQINSNTIYLMIPFMLILWFVGLRKIKVADLNQAEFLQSKDMKML
ncbi:intramembrane metalloprotease PrsW [Bacillus sp. NTK071]|uniref:glutamic-type intramembrane protease PrsW n=1 Tax=Bacillus sp. NTK071 TaxID=2802175 RepID=UPI001A908A6A|nr:glutamic-type intramembrane protease PrsW [Bacillus sp. NTK071]MBN8208014.1 intramembrane metalloprotease PrsW [Bacillus sp. NTK071]